MKTIEEVISGSFLSAEEGLQLYHETSLPEIMALGNSIRQRLHPGKKVGWIIDRNVNITNVCVSACRFCSFHCKPGDESAYITSREQYRQKIAEMFRLGGQQLLLQGGLHPRLGLDFYTELFRFLKEAYPALKLHALGPPEIVHLARLSKKNYAAVLQELVAAGLDSLPGAGAEILCDRVRQQMSRYKCSSEEWLEVMRIAHRMRLLTTATMMFGHLETIEERIAHLIKIRDLQAEKPAGAVGFISFIPWPFQSPNTALQNQHAGDFHTSLHEYARMIALSRIMLPHIPHIQASWLTTGMAAAQLCLHAGADDLGSVMIEENVVAASGVNNTLNAEEMVNLIASAGFEAWQRNQRFEAVGTIE